MPDIKNKFTNLAETFDEINEKSDSNLVFEPAENKELLRRCCEDFPNNSINIAILKEALGVTRRVDDCIVDGRLISAVELALDHQSEEGEESRSQGVIDKLETLRDLNKITPEEYENLRNSEKFIDLLKLEAYAMYWSRHRDKLMSYRNSLEMLLHRLKLFDEGREDYDQLAKSFEV